MNLCSLFAPASIAIVGASHDPSRVGGKPLAYLKRAFRGRIYAINPIRDEVQGLRCYPSLAALPEPVELVLLCVSAAVVPDELRKAAESGAKAAVIFAAGFGETHDAEGMALEATVARIARESGMVVLGPNTTGAANLSNGAFATFATPFRDATLVESAGLAVIGQSGATCNAIVTLAQSHGIDVRYYMATGNETCLGLADALSHFAEDPLLSAVVAYVEGIRHGAEFLRAARRLSERGVPLIVLKVGTSEKGREASASHTAALAGDASVVRAAFAAANVIEAQDLGHLEDLTFLSQYSKRRLGARVGVLTASGAAGVMVADALGHLGARMLKMPTLSAPLQASLRERIPAFGMVSNPVDLTANVLTNEGMVAHTIRALTGSDELDVLVFVLAGHVLARIQPDLEAAAADTDKMILVIDPDATFPRNALRTSGVPVFHRFRDALAALDTLALWHVRRRQAAEATDDPAPAPVSEAARSQADAVFRRARIDARRSHLSEAEGFELLEAFGVPVPKRAVLTRATDAAQAVAHTGTPAVLKILSADIQHKSDVGGLRMNLRSSEEIASAFEAILADVAANAPHATIEGALLQAQLRPVAELLVGIRKDPAFGLCMTIGTGGVQAELLADVVTILLPADEAAVHAALQQLRLYPLLCGYRGSVPSDVEAACAAIARLSTCAQAIAAHITELEINPLALNPQGAGVAALDCLVALDRGA